EAALDLHRSDVARRRGVQGVVGHQHGVDAQTLGGAKDDLLDRLGRRVGVYPDPHFSWILPPPGMPPPGKPPPGMPPVSGITSEEAASRRISLRRSMVS